MKVTIEKNYKNIYTIRQVEQAKAVIKFMKDDESTVKDYAAYAVNEALKNKGDCLDRILEATATTALNCRAWNNYTDDSENLDVWIEAIAKTIDGFIEIGAYLTDIWQSGAVDYASHMYIRYYTKD